MATTLNVLKAAGAPQIFRALDRPRWLVCAFAVAVSFGVANSADAAPTAQFYDENSNVPLSQITPLKETTKASAKCAQDNAKKRKAKRQPSTFKWQASANISGSNLVISAGKSVANCPAAFPVTGTLTTKSDGIRTTGPKDIGRETQLRFRGTIARDLTSSDKNPTYHGVLLTNEANRRRAQGAPKLMIQLAGIEVAEVK
jgi:hypothetical protein